MDRQQVIMIGSIIVIAVAAMLWFKPFTGGGGGHGDNNANLPDGAWYICGDAGCAHEFNLTVKQLEAHYAATYGQVRTQPPCPKCSKTQSQRAHNCAACGKVSPQTSSTTACPACKAPITSP